MAAAAPICQTFVATADLSSKQFLYMVLVSGTDRGVTIATAETDNCVGILQNKPTSGQAALVAIGGTSKVEGDSALAVGDKVGPQSDGQAQKIVEGTDVTVNIMGDVIASCSAAGELAVVTVDKQGLGD